MELSKKMGLQTGVLSTYRDFVDVVSRLMFIGVLKTNTHIQTNWFKFNFTHLFSAHYIYL